LVPGVCSLRIPDIPNPCRIISPVDSLRSNQTDWDEESLWPTYTTLTDVEVVFRSLKSELGLWPIYHHKPVRSEGHLLLTVIAYPLVQVIRKRFKQRVTVTFRRGDGRTLHVRKAARVEPHQKVICDALGIDPAPGGVRKMMV
jgi:hypothetical protein